MIWVGWVWYYAIHICVPNSLCRNISALSKLRENAVISAVLYTNLNGIVPYPTNPAIPGSRTTAEKDDLSAAYPGERYTPFHKSLGEPSQKNIIVYYTPGR